MQKTRKERNMQVEVLPRSQGEGSEARRASARREKRAEMQVKLKDIMRTKLKNKK